MTTPDLAGWVPLLLSWDGGRPVVEWCYLGTRRFLDPFFEQTLEQALRLPFNLVFRRQTPVEALAGWQARSPGLEPTGLIFHLSRCGSTLVSQMLAALPQNVVLSEAGPIDGVLRAPGRAPGVTDEQRVAWLRGMVSALAQRRHPGERHLFIKFDSWHALELPLIRRAFPHTPWVFLYRDPVEVLVSQVRQRGAQMVPGLLDPAVLGLDPACVHGMAAEEYCARVVARIAEAALARHAADPGLLVNYDELPAAVCPALTDFCGATYSAADRERMLEAARFDAKNPSLFFTDDRRDKQGRATEAVRRAADAWLRPLHERLEALRRAGQSELFGERGASAP